MLNDVSCARPKAKILIYATFPLIQQTLRKQIETERGLSVTETAAATAELLEKTARLKPDIVLLCLLQSERNSLEILSSLTAVAPDVKTIILHSPDCAVDHREAVRLGATGIVSTEQSERALIRALAQVAEGGVWLEQKLLSQLLNGSVRRPSNGERKFYLRNHELTKRESEVVGMIGLGLCNRKISEQLFISEATVQRHLSSIYSKLNVEDRLNLAIYAHREQMVIPVLPAVPNIVRRNSMMTVSC